MIKLTDTDWLNEDKVLTVRTQEVGCCIYYHDGDKVDIWILEELSAEEVVRRIKEAKR